MGFIPAIQRWFNMCISINVKNHINKIKDKNHVSQQMQKENTKQNITSFYNENLRRVHKEETYLNIIRSNNDKPTAESFFSKI